MTVPAIVFLCLFVLASAALVWSLADARRARQRAAADREGLRDELDSVRQTAAASDAEARLATDQLSEAQRTEEALRGERDTTIEALSAVRAEHAVAAARHTEIERSLEEKRAFLAEQLAESERRREQSDKRLEEAFGRIANETLDRSSKQLLEMTSQVVQRARGEHQSDLDQRKQAIEAMVKPIGETLEKTRARMDEVERARTESFARLDEKLREQLELAGQLRRSTESLSRALSKPEVRGRYGELQLRRVAELAGMVSYCDFTEQTTTEDSDGNRLRPDMVVRLPNERVVAVDAKCNIDAYIRAAETTDEAERERLLDKFAADVADQSKKLASKNYWSAFKGSPEFVVMFVPGDQFLDAALSRRPDVLEYAASHKVIMASPATLIGLLRAVAVGWREASLAENADRLLALGAELHERSAVVLDHAAGLGASLGKAVERYNKFVASAETRLLPTLRKFEDAGARSAKALPEPPTVTVSARRINAEAPSGTNTGSSGDLLLNAGDGPDGG